MHFANLCSGHVSRWKRAACAAVLVLAVGACTATEPDPVAGPKLDPNPSLTIGGDRPAKVVLPEDYSIHARYPLVVLLHGYGANAEAQDFVFHLRRRVTKRQFILVLPEGNLDPTGAQYWNSMPDCCDLGLPNDIDDVAYLSGLLDEAAELYAIDPARVNFVGHSNGGYMSYRMACEIPERIHAVAVLAGSVFLDEADCKGTEPVSVLHMHGTADDVVPYEEDLVMEPGEFPLITVGAEAAVQRWVDKAGCTGNPATAAADLLSGIAGAETEMRTWSTCADGVTVSLWRMTGGDHLVLDVNDTFRDGVVDFLLAP